MAGGHRRLTHSLVLSLPLVLLAVVLWSVQPVAAVGVGLLAWGQWLHLLGDLVTPSGVPLLYPLTTRDTHLLPRPLTTIGEPLIASAALLCGGWLLIP
jgi:inner membrane protein